MNMGSRYFIKLMAMAALLLASEGSYAQTETAEKNNQLNIGLNYLTHGEVRGGGMPEAENSSVNVENQANFLMGRLRLNVNYARPGLEAKAVIQNSAIWGMKGNQSLNLYEGWVKGSTKCGLFAQVGRVALAYDDERIIGTNDFAMAALSHDVLRIGYEGHGHKAHAIFAYNQNPSNVFGGTYYENGAQYYKTMQTLWYHYDVPKIPLGVSLLFMNIGEQAGFQEGQTGYKDNPEHTEYQQLFGGYVNFHPKYLTLEGSYYRQTGNNANEYMLSAPIKAWMAGVKATIKPSEYYGFILGYDYLSGDDYMPVAQKGTFWMVKHEVPKGFSPVYGSRTKFYGILDYFYRSAYLDGFTPGLQNTYAGITCKPFSKLECQVAYHYMATATDLNGLDKTLGHAIELEASYRISKDIKFVAAYTQMHGTETMDRLKQGKGDANARWGWFSLVVSPTLFKTNW